MAVEANSKYSIDTEGLGSEHKRTFFLKVGEKFELLFPKS